MVKEILKVAIPVAILYIKNKKISNLKSIIEQQEKTIKFLSKENNKVFYYLGKSKLN